MKSIRMGVVVASVLAAGLLVYGCVERVKQPVALEASAGGSSIELFATLGVGEFDAKTTPLYTKLRRAAHNAAVSLQKGTITVDDAKLVQTNVATLKSKLQAAEHLCKPNGQGKCTGDGKAADALVAEVAAAL